MTLFLTDDELYELTDRKTHPAQVLQLRHMGIDHKILADGSVKVLRAHIDKVFGAATDMTAPRKRTAPNWGAL